jgi:LuxR family maltose regulon positive regulatory protein
VSSQPTPQSCPALEELDRGVQFKLVLFVAPGGSGKSEIIQCWRQRSDIFQSINPICLTIEPEDNQVENFLNKFLSEFKIWDLDLEVPSLVQSVCQQDTKEVVELIKSSGTGLGPAIESLLNGLINRIMLLPGDRFIILHDYHQVDNASIHAMVAHLLDYLPAQLHLVITSRITPPLQIPRLRARRELLEIGPGDI